MDLTTYALKHGLLLSAHPYYNESHPTNAQYLVPLAKLGFLPSQATLETVISWPPWMAEQEAEAWLDAATELLGLKIKRRTLWASFEQVRELPGFALWLKAIFHYMTTGVIDLSQPTGLQELDGANPQNNIFPVAFASPKRVAQLLAQKAATQTSLTPDDVEALRYFGPHFDGLFTEFASRENAMLFAAILQRADLAQSPTDVLRLAAWLSGWNPTELGQKKFARFSRAQRRLMLHAMEYALKRNRDVGTRQAQFIRLNERLHSGEKQSRFRFPKAFAFFAALSAGKIQTRPHIDNPRLAWSERLAASTPGQLVRRALMVARQTDGAQVHTNLFRHRLRQASTTQLLQAWAQVQSRQSKKIALIAGEKPKFKVYPPRVLHESDMPYAGQLGEALQEALLERFAKLPGLGNVFIAESLFNLALPFGERTNAASLGTPRGSVYPILPGDKLNFGIHWENIQQQSGGALELTYRSRVDLDLSVILFDAEFANPTEVSWRSLRHFGSTEVLHSGDVTDGPASEFIQVVGHFGYAVPVITTFTGQPFDSFTNEFVSFFANQQLSKGYYNPATVKARTALSGKYHYALPMIADLVTGRLIVANLYARGLSVVAMQSNNVLAATLRSIIERKFITWGELAQLQLQARGGQRVSDIAAAQVVWDAPQPDWLK